MNAVQVLAVIGGLTLAAVIGVSDAPNAVAALVSGRTRSYPAVAAGFTILGGHQVVTTVARRLWRSSATDDLAAQSSAAAVIFLAAWRGLPLSTSTVVTSAKVGTGFSRRPRHLQRQLVLSILGAWLITLPACGIAGAVLVAAWRLAR